VVQDLLTSRLRYNQKGPCAQAAHRRLGARHVARGACRRQSVESCGGGLDHRRMQDHCARARGLSGHFVLGQTCRPGSVGFNPAKYVCDGFIPDVFGVCFRPTISVAHDGTAPQGMGRCRCERGAPLQYYETPSRIHVGIVPTTPTPWSRCGLRVFGKSFTGCSGQVLPHG
jgi:hypothetical protein